MKAGDVVRLNSGGACITVDEIRADGFVCCWWFKGEELMKDAFRPECIRPVVTQGAYLPRSLDVSWSVDEWEPPLG